MPTLRMLPYTVELALPKLEYNPGNAGGIGAQPVVQFNEWLTLPRSYQRYSALAVQLLENAHSEPAPITKPALVSEFDPDQLAKPRPGVPALTEPWLLT